MKVFKTKSDIIAFLSKQRAQKLSIGLVPTMGALHAGHLSLLSECRKNCDVVVASIFVNPTQFNDPSDLEKYPRTIEKDLEALIGVGCDVLFYPGVAEMYPAGAQEKHFQLGDLEHLFEGAFRPGHFQGVCQIVEKLFSIIQPSQVFFGQKDYQQCMVIKKLLQLTPEFSGIEMKVIPIKREASGLAMSSRNVRLSDEESKLATLIYQNLQQISKNLSPSNLKDQVEKATSHLQQNGFSVDYVAIADAETFQTVTSWDGKRNLVVLIAAFVGEVRLIDNLVIHELESCLN